MNGYRGIFTKAPIQSFFVNLITGTIVSNNKTIRRGIDWLGLGKRPKQSKPFVTSSDWGCRRSNDIKRISQGKENAFEKGIIILDPSMLHKTGKHMGKVNYHYSGNYKEKEWGICLLMFSSQMENIGFP